MARISQRWRAGWVSGMDQQAVLYSWMEAPVFAANHSYADDSTHLKRIQQLDSDLYQRFQEKLVLGTLLSRPLVSFQANKGRPVYRWYKYKEAFSAALVEYLLEHFQIKCGTVLDPFAGSGTTLFAASAQGLNADGVELLPIGQQIIQMRVLAQRELTSDDLERLTWWMQERPWLTSTYRAVLPELRITHGAYPERTQVQLERFLGLSQHE